VARIRLFRTSQFPYHVVARSNNQEWFYLPPREFSEIFIEKAEATWREYDVSFHAFVIMSNHIHLLISTPRANIDSAMNYLLREICRAVNQRTGRTNHLFGGPYKWSLIQKPDHYGHAYKYIYRNPVRARICTWVEEYPHSSIQVKLGNLDSPFPLIPSVLESGIVFTGPLADQLHWLNCPSGDMLEGSIRHALKHRMFKMAVRRTSRKFQELSQASEKFLD